MELWCAVEIGRDFDSCVCASPSSTQSFCRKKEVKFFSKDENKATVAFSVRFSFSLSLSVCFLRSTLLRRRQESSREIIRVHLLLLLLLLLRMFFFSSFPSTLGKFYSRRHHARRGVCGRFALFLAYFLFVVTFFLWAELCLCSLLLLFLLQGRIFISTMLFPSIQCVGNTLKFLS